MVDKMYAPMYNIIGVYWRINMLINLTELFTREGKTNDYAVELAHNSKEAQTHPHIPAAAKPTYSLPNNRFHHHFI